MTYEIQNRGKYKKLNWYITEQKFISLLITNDTTNILSLSQKSKFATSSCEGTSNLRVEQQPYIKVYKKNKN